MSVSRVEYEAALKRVREERCEGRACLQVPSCSCVLLTLAALGLDEPPTEPKPFDVRDHPMAFPSHVDEPPIAKVCCEKCGSTDIDFDGSDIDKCRACGHWRYRVVVPPAEPPKAGT